MGSNRLFYANELNDPTAVCIACEYPATPDNPIIMVRGRPSHVKCPPALELAREQKELAARNASMWSFASNNKFVPAQPENSTNQETFATPKQPKVQEMTRPDASSDYDESGTPVPPNH